MAAPWKSTILESLKERDGQNRRIHELVANYELLWEKWEFAQSDCTRLQYERNHLQSELMRARKTGPTVSLESGEPPSTLELSLAQSTVVKLETKMKEKDEKFMAQNEELTQLLRKNAELSGEVNKQSKELAKKDEEIATKDARCKELSAMNDNLKVVIDELEKELSRKSNTLQTIKDEHDVLQKTCDSLERHNRDTVVENERLVTQMLNYKHEIAVYMNKELQLEKQIQDLKKQQQQGMSLASPAGKQPSTKGFSEIFSMFKKTKDPSLSSQDDSPRFYRAESIDRSIKPQIYKTHVDAHSGSIGAVSFSPTGTYMATGGFDNTVKVWDATSLDTCSQLTCTLRGCTQGVSSVQFDSDERSVLCSSNDKTVKIWSLQDQRLRHTLTGHGNRVLSAKYLQDGSKVISGSHDRTLILWDIIRGQRIHTFMVGSSCNDVAIGHGQVCTFISGHFDKRVRLWDEKTKSNTEIALEGRVTSLDVSIDGNKLLCCCQDNTLRIVDLRQMCVLDTLSSDGFVVDRDCVRARFSTDGLYAAAGSNNGVTYIWECNHPDKVNTIKYDEEPTLSCSWHSKGYYFVTVGENHKVVFWAE